MPLSRKQVEAWQTILAPETRFILLDGSIRSGKTFSSILGFLHLLTMDDCPTPAAIIGKTRTTVPRVAGGFLYESGAPVGDDELALFE